MLRAAPHLLANLHTERRGTACSEKWRQSRLLARPSASCRTGPEGLYLIPPSQHCVWGVWAVLSDLKLVSDVAKFLSGQVETNWFTSVIVSDKSVAVERSQVAKGRVHKWEETLLLLAFL